MIRAILYLIGILVATAGLHWLRNRPGTITIEWLGHLAEISVLGGLVLLAAFLAGVLAVAWLLGRLWRSPAAISRFVDSRRRKRGLDALTGGIVAVVTGDPALAQRYAAQARKTLPHEPLTLLLRAQAAQISGDRATARRIFEAMLGSRDTDQLGLRGLFLEAEREGEHEAARQYAQRALRLNPKLGWAVEALFDLSCRAGDWQEALAALDIAERQRLIEKPLARRRRALLLTAQAQALEEDEPEKALDRALEAHQLARDLVPAAAIAGRILAARGRTAQAVRVLGRTWRHAPHPDLATAYAYARPGDSPRDRLDRVRYLARLTPNHPEALMAVATAALDARAWDEARDALKTLLDSGRVTARVCALMARIEAEQFGDVGRVREWLARAVGAERDPAWIADGIAYERWSPVSPTSGRLDAMRWDVPDTGPSERAAATALAAKLESMLGLGPAAPPASGIPPRSVERTPEEAVSTAPAPVASTPAGVELPAPLPPPRPASTPQAAEPHHAATPTVPADTPTTVTAGPVHPRPHRPAEPRIFVPPRPPDDPGVATADSDSDDLQGRRGKA